MCLLVTVSDVTRSHRSEYFLALPTAFTLTLLLASHDMRYERRGRVWQSVENSKLSSTSFVGKISFSAFDIEGTVTRDVFSDPKIESLRDKFEYLIP